jgi:polyisoprenoid-binding protein YceI
VLAAVAISAPAAHAERFEIRPEADNLVKFESSAPLESFEGKTGAVSGWIEVDPAAVGDSVAVVIEVELATLDTGIPMRNTHMRDNHLETEEYPTAVFRGATVLSPSGVMLEPATSTSFEVVGDLDLHGVTRRLAASVNVTHEDRDGTAVLHVVTSFDVNLADHDITRPKFLFLKLGEAQRVTVDIVAAEVR